MVYGLRNYHAVVGTPNISLAVFGFCVLLWRSFKHLEQSSRLLFYQQSISFIRWPLNGIGNNSFCSEDLVVFARRNTVIVKNFLRTVTKDQRVMIIVLRLGEKRKRSVVSKEQDMAVCGMYDPRGRLPYNKGQGRSS